MNLVYPLDLIVLSFSLSLSLPLQLSFFSFSLPLFPPYPFRLLVYYFIRTIVLLLLFPRWILNSNSNSIATTRVITSVLRREQRKKFVAEIRGDWEYSDSLGWNKKLANDTIGSLKCLFTATEWIMDWWQNTGGDINIVSGTLYITCIEYII